MPTQGPRPAIAVRNLRWLHGFREVLVVAAVYITYSAVRSLSGDAADAAVARAEDLVRWQQQWRLNWEPDIQAWTLDRLPLMHIANFIYFWLHLPLLPIFALWMFLTNPRSYSFLRNVWVITQLIGVTAFYFLPVAPPRLLPDGYGFVDSMALYSPINYTTSEAGLLVNKYAAFPSLHFAWSFIIAVGLYQTLPWRWTRLLALVVPVASFWSIVATGNHFIADALGGAIVVAVGFLVALGIDRLLSSRRGRQAEGDVPAEPLRTGRRRAGSESDDEVAPRCRQETCRSK